MIQKFVQLNLKMNKVQAAVAGRKHLDSTKVIFDAFEWSLALLQLFTPILVEPGANYSFSLTRRHRELRVWIAFLIRWKSKPIGALSSSLSCLIKSIHLSLSLSLLFSRNTQMTFCLNLVFCLSVHLYQILHNYLPIIYILFYLLILILSRSPFTFLKLLINFFRFSDILFILYIL